MYLLPAFFSDFLIKLCKIIVAFVIALTISSLAIIGFLKIRHLDAIIPNVFSIVRLHLESLNSKTYFIRQGANDSLMGKMRRMDDLIIIIIIITLYKYNVIIWNIYDFFNSFYKKNHLTVTVRCNTFKY